MHSIEDLLRLYKKLSPIQPKIQFTQTVLSWNLKSICLEAMGFAESELSYFVFMESELQLTFGEL